MLPLLCVNNFKCSFGNTYQHDVHDDDAAHYECDESDRYDHSGDAASHFIDLIIQVFNIHYAEVVFFISLKPVFIPQRNACVFDRCLKGCAISSLAMNLQTVASENLLMRGEGM